MIIHRKLHKSTLLLIGIASVAIWVLAQNVLREDEWYRYKKKAAETMLVAERVLVARVKGHKIHKPERVLAKKEIFDSEAFRKKAQSVLLGRRRESPVKTTAGLLEAKRAVTDSSFAEVVVGMFRRAGLKEGDTIAVAFTGSFPGANIAVLSAAKTMGLKPVIISSIGASQWGATSLDLTWIDMERILFEEGVFPFRSTAASLGGRRDVQASKSEEDVKKMKEVVRKNGLPLIYERNLKDNVESRMAIYATRAEGKPIKAFVNVGSGIAVLGRYGYRDRFQEGVIFELPQEEFKSRGVMVSMLDKGIPVVNIRNIDRVLLEKELEDSETGVFSGRIKQVIISIVSLIALIGVILVLTILDLKGYMAADKRE